MLVVLGHAIQTVMIQQGSSFVDDYLWNLIYSFHMPAFMAVSGFVAYRAKAASTAGGGGNSLLSVIVRRFRQVMIPYLIWSVAMFFVNHNVEHIYDYILYPNKSLWFLWTLFFIVVIFNCVTQFSSKIKLKEEISIPLAALLLFGVLLIVPDAKFLGVEYVAYYFLYYALGFFIHKYSDYLIVKKWYALGILGVAWFVLGSVYSTQGLPQCIPAIPKVPVSLQYYVYRVFTAIIAIFFVFGVASLLPDGKLRFITKCGQISLGIYAVHMVIRFPIVRLLVSLMPDIQYTPLVIITFVILLMMSVGLVLLFEKWKPTKVLLLGKL